MQAALHPTARNAFRILGVAASTLLESPLADFTLPPKMPLVNWHLQKPGEWVIVYRKSEGVEPDALQTFLQGTPEIVSNLEAGTAKQGATL